MRITLLLLLSSGCPVVADERFIVQPKLQQPPMRNNSSTPEAPPQLSPSVARSKPALVVQPVDDGLHWVSRGSTQSAAPIRGGASNSGQQFTGAFNAEAASSIPRIAPEPREERKVLASLVSQRNMQAIPSIESVGIEPVDTAPGWQAIGERLSHHLRASESLLRRHAIRSARQEAEAAVTYLARSLDLAANQYRSEPYWRAAEQAFQEAQDFYRQQSSDPQSLKRIVDAHQTAVLKSVDLCTVSPLVAAQHYRQSAYENLLAACQGHPWASDVLCALGRTYQAEAEGDGRPNDEKRSRAATYYRAAVQIVPSNAMASNQLGFLLLKMDRPQEALQTLLTALQAHPSEPALENLIEASRRLGETKIYSWGMEQLTVLRSLRPQAVAEPAVTEVDVQTFISLSPYSVGPQISPPASAGLTAAVPATYR